MVSPGTAGRRHRNPGPGETQLETDRRLVRQRIQKIRDELDKVRQRRSQYMERRRRTDVRMATLVGYTNAGKSTLFNALCDAGVPAEDQLFNTLDPVTRRLNMPDGGELLLSDTVGFIQKLSPMVVAAFRATLEELHEADLLLHVIDITHPKAPEQAEVVENTLTDLELGGKPRLLVINKMDLLTDNPGDIAAEALAGLPDLTAAESPAVGGRVFVSAVKGWNLPTLLEVIQEHIGKSMPAGDRAVV